MARGVMPVAWHTATNGLNAVEASVVGVVVGTEAAGAFVVDLSIVAA